jgi:hypothetical protein
LVALLLPFQLLLKQLDAHPAVCRQSRPEAIDWTVGEDTDQVDAMLLQTFRWCSCR